MAKIIYMKNHTELTISLQMNPTQAEIAYWGLEMEQDGTGGGNTITPPVKKNYKARSFCFTINGIEEKEIPMSERVDQWITLFNGVIACRMQLERGESGNLHIQGCIRFKNPRSFLKLKAKLSDMFNSQPHLEKCKGTWEKNVLYCTKLETKVVDGWEYSMGLATVRIVRDPLSGHTLYRWQKQLLQDVENDCEDERKIVWYYDSEGNMGKTALCKHLMITHPSQVCYLSGGKATDISFYISQFVKNEKNDLRVVLFDFPRTLDGRVSYQAIETVKNGIVFCAKYESGTVLFNTPHVIVLANWRPDTSQMSMDRWDVHNISALGAESNRQTLNTIVDAVKADGFLSYGGMGQS